MERVACCRGHGGSQGVVKQVRWQPTEPATLLACGGNDRAVRVFDVRRSGTDPVLELPESHAGAVNTVAFGPATASAAWLLLSSGFDGVIRLWDVRAAAPERPLAEFSGHHGRHKPTLMHPIFYDGGRAVLTGGQNSPHLYQYSVASGGLGAVATLGWTPGCLALHPQDPRRILATCGKAGVWLLDGFGV